MKGLSFIGVVLIVFGSFLPLVHIPIIGNWNYWDVHSGLAIICWFISLLALIAVFFGKKLYTIFLSILFILLFTFTIFAIQNQSKDFFSFLYFDRLIQGATSIVKLKWGWGVEYLGAILLLISSFLKQQTSTKNI